MLTQRLEEKFADLKHQVLVVMVEMREIHREVEKRENHREVLSKRVANMEQEQPVRIPSVQSTRGELASNYAGEKDEHQKVLSEYNKQKERFVDSENSCEQKRQIDAGEQTPQSSQAPKPSKASQPSETSQATESPRSVEATAEQATESPAEKSPQYRPRKNSLGQEGTASLSQQNWEKEKQRLESKLHAHGKSMPKKGVFDDHPELLSFLQAKNWDSDFAHIQNEDLMWDPVDEDIEDDQGLPPWKKKMKSCVNSTKTDFFVSFIIIANTVAMGLQLEFEGTTSAEKVGTEPDEGNWPDAEQTFMAFEHIFTMIFVVELLARLAVNGRRYFKASANWGDLFIVFTAILELYIFPLFASSFPNLSFIRILRIFRLLKALRIIRLVKFFENLRVLMAAVVASMKSFMWSMMLLGMTIIIGSIFMTQSLQSYLQDEQEDLELRATVYTYFGNWSRCLITMFEMTLSIGTWGKCGRIVIFNVSRWYALFFIGYLAWVSFAMIRVISALFIKDTLASADQDCAQVMSELNRDPEYIKSVQRIYNKLDSDNDGSLSFSEMQQMLDDGRLRFYLKKLEIDPRELKGMLELVDDGDQLISFGEFLSGVMMLKVGSRGVDLATLCLENKKVLTKVLAVGNQVDELRQQVNDLQVQHLQTSDIFVSNKHTNSCENRTHTKSSESGTHQ